MKHLSAESALYCRLIIEGMLGFEQKSFHSFTIAPQLSAQSPSLSLNKLHLGSNVISITLHLINGKVETKIVLNEQVIIHKVVENGEKVVVEI